MKIEKIKGLATPPMNRASEKKKAMAYTLIWIGKSSEIVRCAELAAGEAIRKTKNHIMLCPYTFSTSYPNNRAVNINNNPELK